MKSLAISIVIASEWSTGATLAVLTYVASCLAVMVVAIWMMGRHSDRPPQLGRGGGQLMAVASLFWPLWAWYVLPKLWAAGETRRREARAKGEVEQKSAVSATSTGAGNSCARCGDRIRPDEAPRAWGKGVLCTTCAGDLSIK